MQFLGWHFIPLLSPLSLALWIKCILRFAQTSKHIASNHCRIHYQLITAHFRHFYPVNLLKANFFFDFLKNLLHLGFLFHFLFSFFFRKLNMTQVCHITLVNMLISNYMVNIYRLIHMNCNDIDWMMLSMRMQNTVKTIKLNLTSVDDEMHCNIIEYIHRRLITMAW